MTTTKPTRPSVKLVDGHATTTSTAVAQFFGKRHDDVLKRIRATIADCPPEYRRRNFAEASRDVEQPNGGKTTYTEYQLTRDGFTLLAMGFTGKAALAWKIKYIEAFNKLEQRSTERAVTTAVRKLEADRAAEWRKHLAQPAGQPGRYHYPRNMLDQAYFTSPVTGKARVNVAMLSDTTHFISPLLALLNQIRSEGHDVTAPLEEAIALRAILVNADAKIDQIDELVRQIRYKL